MKKEEKTEFFTNMNKGDPVIEKLMKQYTEEQKGADIELKPDDLIVNFDITYDDGKVESHTCGKESEVFGNKEYIEPKVDPEIAKCYREESIDDKDCTCNIDSDDCMDKKDYKCNVDLEESEKWDNCKDEWYTGNKDKSGYCEENFCGEDEKQKNSCGKEKKKCKEPEGEITVYSILQCGESTPLKGVRINLYKLNGVCPVLVEAQYTNEDGKVVFCDLKNGSYRVIEMIDKQYFQKPSYIKWNEVTIDKCNKKDMICIINKIKKCIRN